jgi:mannosyl-3-phosphoglycerate phosphatase
VLDAWPLLLKRPEMVRVLHRIQPHIEHRRRNQTLCGLYRGDQRLASRLHYLSGRGGIGSDQNRQNDRGPEMNWLIVTDLDGTLLDDDYLYAQAAQALDTIAEAYPEARMALASSKTPAEMIELAGRCASDPILIFENGSGMAWRESTLCRPGSERQDGFEIECFGRPYAEVIAALRRLRSSQDYPFRGFSDMASEEVAHLTGLSLCGAEKARRRIGSEPIQWHGDGQTLAEFQARLAEEDLELVMGGRFHHVGSNLNKGRALARLWRLLRFQFGIHARILACGDAPNDLEMMERADHAIVFPSREGDYLELSNPNTRRAPVAGPGAWLNAVTDLLDHHYQAA